MLGYIYIKNMISKEKFGNKDYHFMGAWKYGWANKNRKVHSTKSKESEFNTKRTGRKAESNRPGSFKMGKWLSIIK